MRTSSPSTWRRQQKRAIAMLNRAIARGEVTPASACEECGASDRKIYGAHYNYSPGNSLIVRWLCMPCHRRWDIDTPKPIEITEEMLS